MWSLIISIKEERHMHKQKTVTSRHCVKCEGQREVGRERQREGERKEEMEGSRIWQKTLYIKK